MKALIAAVAFAVSLTALPGRAGAFDRPVAHEAARDHRGALSADGVLGKRAIERIVHRDGFVEIVDLELRRDRYLVEAIRPNGSVHRLALDARNGSVIRQERIGWARGPSPDDHVRRMGMEFRFGF